MPLGFTTFEEHLAVNKTNKPISKQNIIFSASCHGFHFILFGFRQLDFEFLADMGVPSDIFDEPVTGMDFTDSLSENRPQYSQQSSVTSNNPLPRVMSRAVKEMFPESSPVRRPRGHTVRLPGLPATSRSRRMTVTAADTARPHLVTWRHLVSGGRLGTKCRRAEGNRIDKVFSYVDIIASI